MNLLSNFIQKFSYSVWLTAFGLILCTIYIQGTAHSANANTIDGYLSASPMGISILQSFDSGNSVDALNESMIEFSNQHQAGELVVVNDHDNIQRFNPRPSYSRIVGKTTSFKPKIIVCAEFSSIEEGQLARFDVAYDEQLPQQMESGFPVFLNVNQEGKFFYQDAPSVVIIPARTSGITLLIPTEDDQVYEKHGQITVSVRPNESYYIQTTSSCQSEAQTIVSDNDFNRYRPRLVLCADATSIIEGQVARFDVVYHEPLLYKNENDFSVNIDITQTGDFLDDNPPQSMVIPANRSGGTFEVQTIDDQIFENEGRISAKLAPNSQYEIVTSTPCQDEVHVAVQDNDYRPKLIICADSDAIVEGQVARFDIVNNDSTPRKLNFDLTVFVNFSQVGEFIIGPLPRSIVIPANLTGGTLEVLTEDDQISELNGIISARITPNNQYEVITSSPCQEVARITVMDNDASNLPLPIPEISIHSVGSSSFAKGGIAYLKLNSTGVLTKALPISIAVTSTSGLEVGEPSSLSLILPANSSELNFEYQTIYSEFDYSIQAANSSILTFAIQPGNGYTVAVSPDNSTSFNVVTRRITPILGIESQEQTIVEGEQANFTMSMYDSNQELVAISKNLTISMDIRTTGQFIEETLPTQQIIQHGNAQVDISINTVDDEEYEGRGSISVKIVTASDYRTTRSISSSAETQVLDNDFSNEGAIVLSNQTRIHEGEVAIFQVVVPSVNKFDRLIFYDVETELFNYPLPVRTSSDKGLTVTIPANQLTTTIEVQAKREYENFQYGAISVVIKPDVERPDSYNVAKSRNRATLELLHNADYSPVVQISTFGRREVKEGSFFILRVRAVPAPLPGEVLVVDTFEVTEKNSGKIYYDYDDLYHVVIREFGYVDVGVGVNYDLESEEDGELYINLKDDPLKHYRAHAEYNTATLRIVQNNKLTLMAENNRTEAFAGESIKFIVNVERHDQLDLKIPIVVSDPFNFIQWRIAKTVQIPHPLDRGEFSINLKKEIFSQASSYFTVKLGHSREGYYILDRLFSLKINVKGNVASRAEISANQNLPRISVSAEVAKVTLENSFISALAAPRIQTNRNYIEPQLPLVSISPIVSTIDEGDTAIFQISRANSIRDPLSVNIDSTEIGNFLMDHTINSILLNPNQIERILEFNTVDDDLAEDDGMLTVKILPNESYELAGNHTAVVKISDQTDRDSLIQVFTSAYETINPIVLRAMETNLLTAIDGGAELSSKNNGRLDFQIFGQNSIEDILLTSGQVANNDQQFWESLLYQSSFRLNILPLEDTNQKITLWGHGFSTSLDHQVDNQLRTSFGEVNTGLIGIDTNISPSLVAGLSVSQANADAFVDQIDWSNQIQYNSDWTGFHPYILWQSPSKVHKFRISSGYRYGQTSLHNSNVGSESIDSRVILTSIAGKVQLNNANSLNNSITSELNVLGASRLAYQNVDKKESFLLGKQLLNSRIAVLSKHQVNLINNSKLHPYFQLGVNFNKEYKVSDFSWDIAGGSDYSFFQDLVLSANGALQFSKAGQIQERLFSGSLKYDKNLDDRGAKLEISAKNKGYFEESILSLSNSLADLQTASELQEDKLTLDSEIGYGFKLKNLMNNIETFGRYSNYNFDDHEFSLGSRFAIGSNFRLNATVARSFSTVSNDGTKFQLNGKFNW